jgi:hypothetical protein
MQEVWTRMASRKFTRCQFLYLRRMIAWLWRQARQRHGAERSSQHQDHFGLIAERSAVRRTICPFVVSRVVRAPGAAPHSRLGAQLRNSVPTLAGWRLTERLA